MFQLVRNKLIISLILLPGLNFLAFLYALHHPRLNPYTGQSGRLTDLDAPPRYLDYLFGLLRGDLGAVNGSPVLGIVQSASLNSLLLLAISLLIIIFAGPILGMLSISRRKQGITAFGLLLTTLGASMPGFFFGVAIIALMVYNTLLTGRSMPLPMSGFGLDKHLVLPVLVLASRPSLQIARITANLIEQELQQDYFQVARSKGLSHWAIYIKHILPNINAALVTGLGQSARLLIPGIIIVETLFLWPGLGRLFMLVVGVRTDGRLQGQYFAHPELLAAITLIFAFWLLLTDMVSSLIAYRLDPRLRDS